MLRIHKRKIDYINEIHALLVTVADENAIELLVDTLASPFLVDIDTDIQELSAMIKFKKKIGIVLIKESSGSSLRVMTESVFNKL